MDVWLWIGGFLLFALALLSLWAIGKAKDELDVIVRQQLLYGEDADNPNLPQLGEDGSSVHHDQRAPFYPGRFASNLRYWQAPRRR